MMKHFIKVVVSLVVLGFAAQILARILDRSYYPGATALMDGFMESIRLSMAAIGVFITTFIGPILLIAIVVAIAIWALWKIWRSDKKE